MQPEPMRLLRIPQPFDHPDFLFELKYDGFRALAFVEGGRCRLVSRNGYQFPTWPALCAAIASSVRARSAVLDGELVCLDLDGRSNFNALLFRRSVPCFLAFDVLMRDGRDLRGIPLLRRKRVLRALVPRGGSPVRYVESVRGVGAALYRLACEHDSEGVVGKWVHGTYQGGGGTSWLKVKNPNYSQMHGRAELFDAGRGGRRGRRPRGGRPTWPSFSGKRRTQASCRKLGRIHFDRCSQSARRNSSPSCLRRSAD